MAGRSASQAVTRYPGIQVQTSSAGLQIPVGWGTFRCRTNLLWYNDFKATAVRSSSSGGKGGGGSQTTGYNYSASFILGICEGPIDAITTVYVDSQIYTNGPSAADPSGKGTALSQANLSLATGAVGQATWSYLTTNYPTQAIGYSGLAIAFAAAYALDSGATTPNFSFEVRRMSVFGVNNTPDADPSLVVTDFFQNTRTGVPSWISGLLDSVSLTSAANSYQRYCLAAGLLVSPVIDQQRSAQDFLTELLMATNSTVVWSEGLLKFIPYGDLFLTGNGVTYTPNLTPVYSLTDDEFIPSSQGEDPVRVDVEDQSDAYNVVQFEYLDRTNSYNMGVALASDAANVAQYGMRRKDPDAVHCICTPTVAAHAVQLFLQRTLYIRSQYRFSLDWRFALLEPGDLLELTDSGLGLSAYPVRIIQIDEHENAADDSAQYDLICEDLLAGVANAPLYNIQNSLGQGPGSSLDPGGVEANILLWSGDLTQSAWTKSAAAVVANAANDQYGLATADAIVPTGGVTELGTAASTTTATTTSVSNSTGASLAIGTAIVVEAAVSTGTVSSVTDSAGNTYAAGTTVTTSDGKSITPFYSRLTVALPNAGTITAHFSSSSSKQVYMGARAVLSATASPLDTQAAGTVATGTTPSIATGTRGQAQDVLVGFTMVSAGAADAFTESAGFVTDGVAKVTSQSALHRAHAVVSTTASATYAPHLGTSRAYGANVLSFKSSASASAHSVSQTVTTFAGQNYVGSVCIQASAHKNARVTIADASGNGAYVEVDTSAGAILTQGTVLGSGVLVSASINATLVAGIWQVVLAVQAPGSSLKLTVNALDDAGNLSWVGDGSSALFVSQFQLRQGVAIGEYAQTTTAALGPFIFNPTSALAPGVEVWGAVAGGPNWGGAYVWTSIDGTDYQKVGTITGSARYGLLTAAFASHADPDSSDTLSVDLGQSAGELTSATTTTADNGGTTCLVDSEVICFSTATLTNPGRYNLGSYIRRGFFNTTIAAHAAGGHFVRLDDAVFSFPYFGVNAGQAMFAKFQSFNIFGQGAVPLADCIAYSFTPIPAGAGPPAAGAWTAVTAEITSSGYPVPAIIISGACDNANAQLVAFYYRGAGGTTWTEIGSYQASTTSVAVTAVAPNTAYDVGAANIVNGIVGQLTVIASNITTPGDGFGVLAGKTTVGTPDIDPGSVTNPGSALLGTTVTFAGTETTAQLYNITTLGGLVSVKCNGCWVSGSILNPATFNPLVEARLYRDGTLILGPMMVSYESILMFLDNPAAGAHTYKWTLRNSASNSNTYGDIYTEAIEYLR